MEVATGQIATEVYTVTTTVVATVAAITVHTIAGINYLFTHFAPNLIKVLSNSLSLMLGIIMLFGMFIILSKEKDN